MRILRLAVLVTVGGLLFGAAPHRPRATQERLGGPERYLTHVSTDKPIYRAGETVYLRGVVLHAATHKPFPGGLQAQVEIKGPKGDILSQAWTSALQGTLGASWPVPAGAAGGEYTATIRYPNAAQPPAQRKFDVRAYRPPRIKTQIVFAREGYGPGDTVTATLEATRAEGGAPQGAKVTAVARVDEVDVGTVTSAIDASGRCTVKIPLPKAIERGEGTLSFTVEDGGVVETAAKTIPILLQTLDLAFYPEGGDLIAGLKSRVYVTARTPSQKPADLSGVVVDRAGQVVAEVRTEHEGRGRFFLTPQAGEAYFLRLYKPSGIRRRFPLPKVETEGAAITTEQDVTAGGQPVRATVAWTGDRIVRVVLAQRERELDSVTLTAEKQGGAEVVLNPKHAEGALTLTVLEKGGLPLAERLVFVEPARSLHVELKADRDRYVPGGQVKLKVRTTVGGKPVSAVVGLTVTDDSVLELVEKREQAPSLPTMALLESEVRELYDAHVYLNRKDPKSRRAVDLLLATQGWRRFALMEVDAFLQKEGDRARRVLAFATPPPVYRPPPMSKKPAMPHGLPGGAFGGMRGAKRPAAAPMDEEFERAAPMAKAPAGVMSAPPAAMAAPRPAAMPAPAPMPQAAPPPPAAEPVAQAPAQPIIAAAPQKEAKKKERARADEDFMVGGDKADRGIVARPLQMILVREFAHQVRPNRQPTDRLDFTETLYWSAGVVTDPKTGEAEVQFGMSDAVTSFKASAGGFTESGVLGAGEAKLESVQPFYVEAKLPLEVTTGDLVRLPVAFVNGTREPLSGATLGLETRGDIRFQAPSAFDLAADQRLRQVVELAIGAGSHGGPLQLTAAAGPYRDLLTRELNIVPEGFPMRVDFGGVLEKGAKVSHSFTLPDDLVEGSARAQIAVFPSPAGKLSQALERLIQEPNGCFEQTSSTTYPMTMALQYFQSHSGTAPQLVSSAQEKLERGYRRLTGYETPDKGYEWFGQAPGHEALTAFGILHFTDMAKVREVDGEMLARTKEWLMRQRDGKGGFERKRRALHVWVEDRDASDAYITWALLEAGQRELSSEIARVKEAGSTSKNSYVTALAANVLALAGDTSGAEGLMRALAGKQDERGVLTGATQSIVGSSGESLEIEATALATLAWLRSPAFTGNVERAMQFLSASCKGGRYGSTQSTVLALRAIVEYDARRSREMALGKIQLVLDGKPMGAPVVVDGSSQGAVPLPDISELLSRGAHTIELRQEGGGRLPYMVSVTANRRTPESSAEAKVAFEVALSRPKLVEGEVAEATVRVTNKTDQVLPTTVAIVGLPGGMEPRHDQLKELVKRKQVDAYEVRGRDVVLYWRGMTPQQSVRVPVSVVAAVPGKYTGPASRAYLYYGDEHKVWLAGLSADIAAK